MKTTSNRTVSHQISLVREIADRYNCDVVVNTKYGAKNRLNGYKVTLVDRQSESPIHVRVLRYRQPSQLWTSEYDGHMYYSNGMHEIRSIAEEMNMIYNEL